MSMALDELRTSPAAELVYPESDGELMADNTEQFDFITWLKTNLDLVVPDFVAGDHLWYPVEGHHEIRVAPDVYVALGRPKGHRGAYLQWKEEGVAPQVVFEWWSPRNDFVEQVRKLRFYDRHGVQEFYAFDSIRRSFSAFHRGPTGLEPVSTEGGLTSPLLGVRMEQVGEELRAWRPDGRPFLTLGEAEAARQEAEAARREAEAARQEAESARQEAESARQEAETARQEAESARQEAEARAEAEAARAQRLAERLRALGLDPDRA